MNESLIKSFAEDILLKIFIFGIIIFSGCSYQTTVGSNADSASSIKVTDTLVSTPIQKLATSTDTSNNISYTVNKTKALRRSRKFGI